MSVRPVVIDIDVQDEVCDQSGPVGLV